MFTNCPNTEKGIRSAALRKTAPHYTDPSIPVRLVVKTDHSCLYQPGCFCKHQVSSFITIRREGRQPQAYRKLSPSWPAYVRPEGAIQDAGREKTSTILASSGLRCSTGNGGMKVIGKPTFFFLLKLIKIWLHHFPNLFLTAYKSCFIGEFHPITVNLVLS